LKGLLNLADIGALSGAQAPTAPMDLMGASQEPQNFEEIAGVQQYETPQPTKEEPDYLNTLRQISQLPMAMSDSDELRQDALENLESYDQANARPQQNPNPNPIQQPGANLDPNDVMSQLASLPAYQQDSDLEREEALQGMQDQSNMKANVPVDGLPRTQSGDLQDPLEHIRAMVEQDPSLMDELPEETRGMLEGSEPNAEKAFTPQSPPQEAKIIPPEQPVTEQDIESYPDQTVRAGAVEQAAQDPLILEDLARLNGMKEIPEEDLARAAQWQNAYSKRLDQLSEEEKGLLQKAESGDLSNLDKFLIGVAIAIPVLMGLRYGAGGFLASAGKGLEGYAGSVEKTQKLDSERSAKASERMGDIQKERLNLGEKDIEVNQKLLNAIPDKQAREFLKDRKIRQIGDRVGISTGDEKDALWFDGNQLETSDEGIKEARKNLSDAKEKIGMMNKGNQVVDDVLEILNAMPENTGAWEAIKSNWGWFTSAGGKNPFGGAPLMIDVKDKDGNIRKVNAFEILKQKTAALQDVYNKINLGRAALTSNVVEHWSAILGDPKDMSEWMTGQDLNTVKDKTKSLKDFLNQGATDQLVGAGFLREPLEAKYPSKTDKPLESTDNVINKMRNQPEAYRPKVK
jgi:hypothetical protein